MFEVMRGQTRLFWTEHRDCIPDRITRRQMKAAGLVLLLDGKPFTERGKLYEH